MTTTRGAGAQTGLRTSPPKVTGRRGARAQAVLSTGPSIWLAAPAMGFFALFALIPLIGVVLLSFMNWDGLAAPTFAGWDNWTRILADPVTQNAMKLSLVLTIATWVTQFPTSLLLGVFMAGRQRYREVYSILYFLPLLFSSAAVGIAFKALLDPNFGFGAALGIDALNKDWLGDPNLSMPTLVFVIAWSFVPFHSLLYQGAARQLPVSIYEAAMIDGAGRVATFFSITVPMLRSTIITSSTLMIVGSLTYFDLIFVMTNGGPGNATRVLPLDMYLRGFRSYDMGGASVVGVILVVVGVAISYGLNRLSGNTKMDSTLEGA